MIRASSRDFNEGASVDAAAIELLHSAIPAEQVKDGAPTASAAAFGAYAGREVGVWEITPGTVTDVEVEELFIVLSGAATVTFLDEDRFAVLGPGSVMQLTEGQRTMWTVTETLRKVYIA